MTAVAAVLHPRVQAHARALADGLRLPADCTITMGADSLLVLDVPRRRPCFIDYAPEVDAWAWTYWTGREHADGDALATAQAAVDAALAHMGLAPAIAAIPGQLTLDGHEVVATVGGTALVPSPEHRSTP